MVGALAWFTAETGYFWRSPLANARFIRLLDFPGTEQAAAISRDGKFVAFLGERDGQIDAWVSAVGSGTYVNLTHGDAGELVNPEIRTPGFSPDLSLVTVWTRRAGGWQPGDVNILAVPTAGGPLRPYLPEAAEFGWSRDGTRLSITRPHPEIRCSCGTQESSESARTAGSTSHRRGCIATFRCGRPTMRSFILSAVCHTMTGTSGEFGRPAQDPNG